MLRVGNDCKCVFWGYQISLQRSTKGGDEVVQFFDDQFFDQLRLIALLQSYSCLYCLNCNAEPGINFFRQFLKGEGRGGSS